MGGDVVDLVESGATQVATAGGKGAQLAELARIEGIRVPPGFCVTTDAFRRAMARVPSLGAAADRLSRLEPDDRDAIAALSADLRRTVQSTPVADELAAAIAQAAGGLGEHVPCAVRSSATAEDLPDTSFAGQHDSYLNVVGPEAIVEHVRRCWASLFTERAVTYRLRNGIDHRAVQMAVVVQRMVLAQAAGVLFTADPVSSNRRIASVEASFGLGEALVSGHVDPDVFAVRDGAIVTRRIATKAVAVHPSPAGGTEEHAVPAERRQLAALSDGQAVELVRLGRQIEAHFGHPQDIEWCLSDDGFAIVQARPITTLFPIPEADDDANHVYVSVGHQQMMTDPMKPLGLSFWQMTTPRPMAEAGGRLFVDVTQRLSSSAVRAGLLTVLGRSDPLMGDALETVLARPDFIPPADDGEPARDPVAPTPEAAPIETDPAIVTVLVKRAETSIAACRRDIEGRSGIALLDFIRTDLQELRRVLFDPDSLRVIMAGMEAGAWLREQLGAWLGEPGAVDALSQSVPGNVTSEMGLALLDVADVIRSHAEVVAFLETAADERFLDELPALAGGQQARDAIQTWLDRYGMRCVGEIDITRTRWSERPEMLVPIILGNVRNFASGAGEQRFKRGRKLARDTERQLLVRVRALPDGERKADETKRMIDRLRTFSGYREFPKYGMVSRYFVYKRALCQEAERLVAAGVLRKADDIFYLRFEELYEVVRTGCVDDELIRARREAFRSFQALTPPRVLTSDGEAVTGTYRRDDVPTGALAGLAVSAGTVEGRARVIRDVAQADLEPGDILVTPYTDPSWTPLFVTIAGLVTEVGGLMTHGAVIAREYGLPAVVGVEHATELIGDGQRIRVHGTGGYVEMLGEPAPPLRRCAP